MISDRSPIPPPRTSQYCLRVPCVFSDYSGDFSPHWLSLASQLFWGNSMVCIPEQWFLCFLGLRVCDASWICGLSSNSGISWLLFPRVFYLCFSSARQAHLLRTLGLHTQLVEVAPQLPDALPTSSTGEQTQCLSLLGKHSSPEPTPSSLTVFGFVMVFLLPLILDSFSCSRFTFHDSSCQSLSTLHKLERSEKRELHLKNCLQEIACRQECGTFSWLLVDGRDSPHWGQCGGHCVWGQCEDRNVEKKYQNVSLGAGC